MRAWAVSQSLLLALLHCACCWGASWDQSKWLVDLTPRGSLEHTVTANREVWVVAVLHEDSGTVVERRARGESLVAVAKALNGVARVGVSICNADCVEGCCKPDSLAKRLGSTKYPSLHLVLPYSARDGSSPIQGLEDVSVWQAKQLKNQSAVWHPKQVSQRRPSLSAHCRLDQVMNWVESKVAYGGKILKTEAEMEQ